MRLKEHKLRRKEDFGVFKCFLRCMKEHGLYKQFRGYRDMIDRCYSSRDNHRGESFLTNIGYWPADASSGIFRQEIKILYMALIINSIPAEDFSYKKGQGGIIDNIKTSFRNYTINPDTFVVKDDYSDIVASALSKCFGLSDEKEETKDIMALIIKGYKMGIPF